MFMYALTRRKVHSSPWYTLHSLFSLDVSNAKNDLLKEHTSKTWLFALIIILDLVKQAKI